MLARLVADTLTRWTVGSFVAPGGSLTPQSVPPLGRVNFTQTSARATSPPDADTTRFLTPFSHVVRAPVAVPIGRLTPYRAPSRTASTRDTLWVYARPPV